MMHAAKSTDCDQYTLKPFKVSSPSDVCSCNGHAHTAAEASAVIAGLGSSGSAGPDEQQSLALQAGVGPGTILVCVAVALEPLLARLYLSLCADMCLCKCSSQELRTAYRGRGKAADTDCQVDT